MYCLRALHLFFSRQVSVRAFYSIVYILRSHSFSESGTGIQHFICNAPKTARISQKLSKTLVQTMAPDILARYPHTIDVGGRGAWCQCKEHQTTWESHANRGLKVSMWNRNLQDFFPFRTSIASHTPTVKKSFRLRPVQRLPVEYLY